MPFSTSYSIHNRSLVELKTNKNKKTLHGLAAYQSFLKQIPEEVCLLLFTYK